jgi:hypothetical protein
MESRTALRQRRASQDLRANNRVGRNHQHAYTLTVVRRGVNNFACKPRSFHTETHYVPEHILATIQPQFSEFSPDTTGTA